MWTYLNYLCTTVVVTAPGLLNLILYRVPPCARHPLFGAQHAKSSEAQEEGGGRGGACSSCV